jgi:hypothetical protein
VSDCTCSCRGLPAQHFQQQPDQHDRQRGVYRTDGAYFTVRRGAVGFLVIFGSPSLLVAWMRGSFWLGLFEFCFLLTMACSSGLCLSNKLLCFSAHDGMLSTHRFILSCLLVIEYVCMHIVGFWCVCVLACSYVCARPRLWVLFEGSSNIVPVQ